MFEGSGNDSVVFDGFTRDGRYVMKRVIQLLCVIGSLSTSVAIAQTATAEKTPPLKKQMATIEILSPWDDLGDGKVKSNPQKDQKSCFDLIRFAFGCYAKDTVGIHFGTRIGVNTSIFQINGGSETRARMIDIGEYRWTDKFMVPDVEPWPALAPGEQRTITVNASGANGASGAPGLPGKPGKPGVAGMNGDGTYTPMPPAAKSEPDVKLPVGYSSKSYATASITEQVGSFVTTPDGKKRNDSYTPLTEAKLGHMYVIRVMNETVDYFVVLRVDELVPGTKVVVSYLKLDLPRAL